MSVRREAFDLVGGFDEEIGRIGLIPIGCEETEFCIRVAAQGDGHQVIFDPAAAVDHYVPAERQRFGYFLRRCYHEGRSKRIVALLRGTSAGLSSERRYVLVTLPSAVLRGLAGAARRPFGALRAAVVVVGLVSTILGYTVEGLRRGPLTRPS
jgi:GT2 family glycosyltransferase